MDLEKNIVEEPSLPIFKKSEEHTEVHKINKHQGLYKQLYC